MPFSSEGCWDKEDRRRGYAWRKYIPEKENFCYYDQISVSDFCSDHFDQFRGECVWMDFYVE